MNFLNKLKSLRTGFQEIISFKTDGEMALVNALQSCFPKEQRSPYVVLDILDKMWRPCLTKQASKKQQCVRLVCWTANLMVNLMPCLIKSNLFGQAVKMD